MAEEKKGFIFDIQRFSIHDGPGIRTTVFLKGCPLSCRWCHNPESQAKRAELAFYPIHCIACGNCLSVCPNRCHFLVENRHGVNRADCSLCGKCSDNCFSDALKVIGRTVTVSEVVDKVLEDIPFYIGSGGMTLSGGEPMFQPEFSLELLKAVKEQGIHTCIETCGFCSQEHLINIVPYTDLFLFDIKASPEVHESWTGVPFEPILHSLHAIDAAGAKTVLRCPLVPGVNTNDGFMRNIAQIAASLNHITGIHLEPYHPIGLSKCEAIGREPGYGYSKMLERSEAEDWAEKLRGKTEVSVMVI